MNLYAISLIFAKKCDHLELNNILDQCISKSGEEALKTIYTKYADEMASKKFYIQQYSKLEIDLNLKF